MGLVAEEQVELKVFQVQGEQAEGLLEEVDPEPGRQLEDVQVDWDTGRKEYINPVRKAQMYSINIPWQEQEAEGLLEEEVKEGHVDPELGRQLEDVQVDWDTGEKYC